MRVEESIEINMPLQEVFNYVSDAGNSPQRGHYLRRRSRAELGQDFCTSV
jgi:hypothetical protein